MKASAVRACDKIFMSQGEAAKYLGVSKDWLEARRSEGMLHFSKVGNTVFYMVSELNSLVIGGAVFGREAFAAEALRGRREK